MMAELSELEKIRSENVHRNNQFLISIGLDSCIKSQSSSRSDATNKTKKNKRILKNTEVDEFLPLRRSPRLDPCKAASNEPSVVSIDVDPSDLQYIISMGHNQIRARKGLIISNGNVNDAIHWIVENQESSSIDNPFITHTVKKTMKLTPALTEVIYDDEGIIRNPITHQILRDYITDVCPEDVDEISDVAISHCVHRLHTMSNKQLATRVKQISTGGSTVSFEKLLVFYYALKVVGLSDLANSAEEALSTRFKRSVHRQ